MNAEAMSARGLLKEWLDGGHCVWWLQEKLKTFFTAVQLTSVDETKLEAAT
jgi:hypothetical protein